MCPYEWTTEHAFLESLLDVDLPITTNCCGQYRNYHNLLWATTQLPQTAVDNIPPTTNYYGQHPI
jgi:hypothetical protein